MHMIARAFVCGTLGLFTAVSAGAITSEEKCEAEKNKIAGKYAFCRQKAEAKAIRKGEAADYSKCDAKYSDKWTNAENRAGPGICPSEGDEATMQEFISQHSDSVAVALAGGALPDCSADLAACNSELGSCDGNLTTCMGDRTTCLGDLGTCGGDLSACQAAILAAEQLIGECNADLAACEDGLNACQNPLCGDDSAGVGEQCDGTDLNGASCASLGFVGGSLSCGITCELDTSNCAGGFPATGQTTAFGAGSDGQVRAGAALVYWDNGDGTVTDQNTGLMWERKDDSGGIHDVDQTFSWSTGTNAMDGTVTTVFLAQLNDVNGGGANCFAGFCDWRIPNIKELQSIIDYQTPDPTISLAFHNGLNDPRSACDSPCILPACACTDADYYWSSTALISNPQVYAYFVDFREGGVDRDSKTALKRVRAVRGGELHGGP